MAIRDTIQIGHPFLKAPNQQIINFTDPQLLQLIQDLTDTMHEVGLIGIAAPQIGENYQVFITEPRETDARPADQADKLRVYINPEIVWRSPEQVTIWEGCGSLSGLFGPVTRAKIIEVEAADLAGRKFRFKADGILGRVIQHEVDHLNGIEFIEVVDDYKKLKSKEFYVKDEKSRPTNLTASKITLKEYHLI